MPLKPAPGFWLPALLTPLVAFETFAIDILVPGFPDMSRALSISDSNVQLMVAAFLGGYALSQLVMGSLSDRFGRRKILLCNLFLMTIATFIPILSSDAPLILFSRLLLGLCAGGCFSASVAVIRDIYAEDKMNRVIGYMFSFCGFFSVLCGVIGGYLAAQYGWRGNFTALFVIASYLLVSIFLLLPETRPESTRISGFEEWKRKTGILLKDRNFLRYLLSGSFIYTTMLVFISAVAFVLDGLFQVDAQTLGICFSVMVLGYSVGAILSSVLKADQMRDRTLTIILTLPMIAISALPFYEYIPLNGAYYIACLFFIVDLVVGFYGPVTTTRITGPYPHLSGTAASLVACCAMILGALSGFIATHFYDGTIWPMMVTMLATSAAALAAFLIFAPRIDHKNVPAF